MGRRVSSLPRVLSRGLTCFFVVLTLVVLLWLPEASVHGYSLSEDSDDTLSDPEGAHLSADSALSQQSTARQPAAAFASSSTAESSTRVLPPWGVEPYVVDRFVHAPHLSHLSIGPLQKHSLPSTTEARLLLGRKALELLKAPTTMAARIPETPGSQPAHAFHDAGQRRAWLLTLPAPRNPEWYKALNIEYTEDTRQRQPFLFYRLIHKSDPEQSMNQYIVRFLGTELQERKSDPLDFLIKWTNAPGLSDLQDVREYARWGRLFH